MDDFQVVNMLKGLYKYLNSIQVLVKVEHKGLINDADRLRCEKLM